MKTVDVLEGGVAAAVDGKQFVICSPAVQVGVNGLDSIKHLILYSIPTSLLPQLIARFDRPSRSLLLH